MLTSERHTSAGTSTGAFTSAGGHRGKTCCSTKAKQDKNMHFSRGNMLTVSARTFLCALMVLKLLKRCPPGAVIDLDSPPKVRDESSKVIYCNISPISVLKSSDNCC